MPDGGHEITTTPDRLGARDRAGAVVTIDAAGCPKATVAQSRTPGGDDVVCVTGNPMGLRDAVADAVARAGEAAFVGCDRTEPVDSGHGRAEERDVTVVENPTGRPAGGADVGSVARVCREREPKRKPNASTAHYDLTCARARVGAGG